jgi:N utilization substance protein A
MKGIRIHAIVREMNNENIDVINYSDNPSVYVQRSLAPAKLKSIEVDKESKTATVVVEKDQVSLAIGRAGQNIRLAIQLTGYQINLIKEGGEEEYDMDLDEFREELGEPLYERLIDEGYETARSILDANMDDLLEIDGLSEDKIKLIKEMMQRELEEAEIDEEGAMKIMEKSAPSKEIKQEIDDANVPKDEATVTDGSKES